MNNHPVVSHEEWLAARKELLQKEKEFTRLPWEKVEKEYVFESSNVKESLSDFFAGRSQLMVYHFMFHPQWEDGCKSCSFWADNYNNMLIHLNQRDVTFVTVSRSPLEKLLAFQQRMGWSFKWVSSLDCDFNYDYHVSFTPEELDKGKVTYNYKTTQFPAPEAPGLSVFYKNEGGEVFHTYSCYARGLDILNGTYNHLDMTPKGRDETNLAYTMEWVRLKDRYE